MHSLATTYSYIQLALSSSHSLVTTHSSSAPTLLIPLHSLHRSHSLASTYSHIPLLLSRSHPLASTPLLSVTYLPSSHSLCQSFPRFSCFLLSSYPFAPAYFSPLSCHSPASPISVPCSHSSLPMLFCSQPPTLTSYAYTLSLSPCSYFSGICSFTPNLLLLLSPQPFSDSPILLILALLFLFFCSILFFLINLLA